MPGKLVEVERKRQLPDGGEHLEALLANLGWQAGPSVAEVDTYYSRPDVDYLETMECLWVRQRGESTEITYKPASDDGARGATHMVSGPETNLVLGPGQAATAEEMLVRIGMRLLVRLEKTRTVYRHPAYREVVVAIDTVAGVGSFVEVEVLSADADDAAELVGQVEEQLDLLDCPAVDLPYRDLALSRAGTG
ncbi:class IV adenylate cyclase [Streptantibioticus rubrisoli]|uniref:Class IV adenylate cyclase n=1 Tax=Streptantibioticus rubrisoli TaxID=1387313 RepID=A0ABT1P696_9ACTN|nr:class IV adenylate cyclase [Streptantibioticus rubrisoli]MCQ4040886.1 class IV adenylate cyclase [Streptantibioticus rubrisoli]